MRFGQPLNIRTAARFRISNAVEKTKKRLKKFKRCLKGIRTTVFFSFVIASFIGLASHQYDYRFSPKFSIILLFLIVLNYYNIREYVRRKHVCSSCLKTHNIAILVIILFLFCFSWVYTLLCLLVYSPIQALFPSAFFGLLSMLSFLAVIPSIPRFSSSEEKIDYSDLHDHMESFIRHRARIIKRDVMSIEDANNVHNCLKKSLEILEKWIDKEKMEEEWNKVRDLIEIFRSATSYLEMRISEKNLNELEETMKSEKWPKIINLGALSLYRIWQAFKDERCDFENLQPYIHQPLIFVLKKNLSTYTDFYQWVPNGFGKSVGKINDEICCQFLKSVGLDEPSPGFKALVYSFPDIGVSDSKSMSKYIEKMSESFHEIRHLVLIGTPISEMEDIPENTMRTLEENSIRFCIGQENGFSDSFESTSIIRNEFDLSLLLYIMYYWANICHVAHEEIGSEENENSASSEFIYELYQKARSMKEDEAFRFVEKIFRPYRYGGYSTLSLFDYFDSPKNHKETEELISRFLVEDLMPNIHDYDLVISIDFKATTILRSMKSKFPTLKPTLEDIWKSSYVFEQVYEDKSVCIIDDAIKTGEHVSPFLEYVLKNGARKVHVYALTGIDSRIQKIRKKFGKYGKEIRFFCREHPENEKQFAEEYGTKICSYMNFTFIPSDKDHFYYECKPKKPLNRLDFLEIAGTLEKVESLENAGTCRRPYFVVETGIRTPKNLKVSVHYENFDIHKHLPLVFKRKKKMLYKMRIFIHGETGTIYLVPIVMDLDLGEWNRYECDKSGLFCFQDNIRSEYQEQIEKKRTHEQEKNDEERICRECFHFHCKKIFLDYFLKELDVSLGKSDLRIDIVDAGWDEVEKKYGINGKWKNLIKESVEGLKFISIDLGRRDHKHV